MICLSFKYRIYKISYMRTLLIDANGMITNYTILTQKSKYAQEYFLRMKFVTLFSAIVF